MLGYERGQRIARALGNALVAPVIRPGISEHHMKFPGSFTLETDTFKRLLRDTCASVARHGFRNIVLIPTHGGNYNAMLEQQPALQSELPKVRIVLMERADSMAAHGVIQPELEIDPARAGIHAGLVETALVLVHRPDLVNMEAAPAGWVGEIGPEQMDLLIAEGVHALSDNGVLGDARGATSAMGEAYLNRWTEIYAAIIEQRLGEPG